MPQGLVGLRFWLRLQAGRWGDCKSSVQFFSAVGTWQLSNLEGPKPNPGTFQEKPWWLSRYILTAPWPSDHVLWGVSREKSLENSENAWTYSCTTGGFNCEQSVNSLWARDVVCICVHFSVWVWGGARACVLSCEHCAIIIFKVNPESQWRAANLAHWVSGLQYFTPAVYWIPPALFPTLSSSLCRWCYMGKLQSCSQEKGD